VVSANRPANQEGWYRNRCFQPCRWFTPTEAANIHAMHPELSEQEALKDFSSTLGPLGAPQEFTEINEALRGGMKFREYSVKFAKTSFRVWVYEMPDGKLEEYQVVPQE